MTQVFLLGGLFLIAATIMVPIASKLKLGSVLGYIIAGIAISPLLSMLQVNVLTLQHFAEFGVVMMLFLVGLELEPKALWKMKHKLLGLGGLQVLITSGLFTALGMAFGLAFQTAVAVSFVFTLSSTAIVLQTLSEKRLMNSDGGRDSFAVLLVQDIGVIPMLAIIPLLALPELSRLGGADAAVHHGTFSLVEGLNSWQRALVTLLALSSILVVGTKVSRPFFRFVTAAKLREILVATALLWVVGISLLMSLIELSPALGTFIAGVVLANNEYRHQLEGDIEPFKGLLLGLFFITVGASINFDLLFDKTALVIALTAGVIATKSLVLFGLSILFRMRGSNRWLFTLGLAQAGEFAFVLLSFAVNSHALSQELSQLLQLVVALSMLLTPALFIFHERFLSSVPALLQRESDPIQDQEPILIAGHGRFGGVVNRMLRGLGFNTTVLDYNYDQLEVLRKFGIQVYYGDATRPDLLEAAGIQQAKVFIVAIDGREAITALVKHCTKHYPQLHVIARAYDRHHVYDLWAAGCRDIIRETFDSSIRTGRSAMEALGLHPFEAERKTRCFVDLDREMMVKLASLYKADVPPHENEAYIKGVAEIRRKTEGILRGQDRSYLNRSDRGWSPPTNDD